jgi:3'-phosphoadenosine 5'-phosphosulfate sulfotransferase (PAPS reductase)/FAD synthetase
MKKNLRILSLGAGVQSSTLALMIEKGEIPMVDAAIFADVGAEPKKVIKWLDFLKKKVSFPVYIVQWRNLKQDIIDASKGEYKSFSAPFFTQNIITGKKGMIRRMCTTDYKIKPVTKKIRELLGYKKGERVKKETKVELLMGISIDEVQRMKTNKLKYITNIYPLIDNKLTRNDCIKWMNNNNYPTPPRSACTFCPFHSNKEWIEVKKDKDEWNEVIKIDNLIRSNIRFNKSAGSEKLKDKLFLHRDLKPINEIDFNKKTDQLDLFNNECEGMCGV